MQDIWPWVAFAITLIVLSRVFGDNPLFRISQYFYVGLALGYTVTVLLTALFVEPIRGFNSQAPAQQALQLMPLIIGILLFTRLGKQSVSWIANFPLALLIGVAAATALTGVILGTLLPQMKEILVSLRDYTAYQNGILSLTDLIGKLVLLIGIILVLLSFSFTNNKVNPETNVIEPRTIHKIGRLILIFSLGVVFADALITYQIALIDRIQFITRQLGLG